MDDDGKLQGHTSQCPPGESNLSQLLHLRQVGCQSLPRDVLRSAEEQKHLLIKQTFVISCLNLMHTACTSSG